MLDLLDDIAQKAYDDGYDSGLDYFFNNFRDSMEIPEKYNDPLFSDIWYDGFKAARWEHTVASIKAWFK